MAYDRNNRRRGDEEAQREFTERVVSLNRVSETVKGGRVAKVASSATVRAASVTARARQAKFPRLSARAWRTPRSTSST